jgi:EmrB/QacA subfamily drug resistance transporter
MNRQIGLPFIGVLCGTMANMLMQTVVAAILPQITVELGSRELYGWVFSSFLIASTVTIPIFAKLSDQYGHRQLFVTGMSIFLLGTLFCGLAHSMPILIIARTVQGIGVGAVGPSTIALISLMFSAENRGGAMGIYAATQLLANIAGPLAGGFVAETWGWQWSFYMDVPVAALALGMVFASSNLFSARPKLPRGKLDVLGALLLGIAVTLLIQGFTHGGKIGMDWVTVSLVGIGLGLFLLFFMQEKRHPDPVIPSGLLRVKNVLLANISAFLVGIILYGAIAILPLYAEQVLGKGAGNNGKFLLPLMIGMGLGVIGGGRLLKKVSYRNMSRIGWGFTLASSLTLTIVSKYGLYHASLWICIWGIGTGIGILIPTFLLPAQNAVSSDKQAVVGGLIQLNRNMGGAIGIPILTILLQNSNYSGLGAGRFPLIFAAITLLAGIGLIVGMQYRGRADSESSPTNRPKSLA